MWIESFSPGFTTMAFMATSLRHSALSKVRQRIGRRDRVALAPVVVLVTLEAAALGLPCAWLKRPLRRGVAGGADRLVRQQDVGGLRAGLRRVTARALDHQVRRVIERRARHPLRRDVRRGVRREGRRRDSLMAFGARLVPEDALVRRRPPAYPLLGVLRPRLLRPPEVQPPPPEAPATLAHVARVLADA